MFWFVFVPIVLFIFLLIYILISTVRTSAHSTVRSQQKKRKPKPKKEPKKPKAKKRVKVDKPKPKAAEEATPKGEAPAAAVIPEPSVTEEAAEPVVEEVPAATADVAFIEEDEPVVEAQRVVEVVSEPEPVVEEVSPVIEELPEPEEAAVEIAVEVPEEVVAETPPAEEAGYDYAPFDNTRTMEEFGLSKEEANDFILDMIQQIESELPGLEEAVSAHDSTKIEDISHMLKGSATNLGTGGVADVLVDFNTYMKTSDDPSEIAKHMHNFRRALKELKEQFQ